MLQYGIVETKMQMFLLQKSPTAGNDEKQLYSQALLSYGAIFWWVVLTAECVDKILCIQFKKPLWQYWYFCIPLTILFSN